MILYILAKVLLNLWRQPYNSCRPRLNPNVLTCASRRLSPKPRSFARNSRRPIPSPRVLTHSITKHALYVKHAIAAPNYEKSAGPKADGVSEKLGHPSNLHFSSLIIKPKAYGGVPTPQEFEKLLGGRGPAPPKSFTNS